jgi:hypothetical protein
MRGEEILLACPVNPKEDDHAWLQNEWDVYESRVPVFFPPGYVVPRVCSHCGAIHAEDAIVLAAGGWELEEGRRLQPPGYALYMERLLGVVVAHLIDHVRCPVPAVTVYAAHFTADQLATFNHLVTRKHVLT